MRLQFFDVSQLPELMSWFPDRRSCETWGGPHFRFPFTDASFREDAKLDSLPSWALVPESGALAGFGQYYQRLGRCHLGRLAIAPHLRGGGLGSRLIHELSERGKTELGVESLSLFVHPDNERALRLYERLGFSVVQYPEPLSGLDGCTYMVAPGHQATGCVIRRGEVRDAAALAAFAARTFTETFAADNRPDDMRAHLAATYGVQQQGTELSDPEVITILAESGGELVAYAQVRRKQAPPSVNHAAPVELHRFYLDHKVHGTGLAATLVEEARSAAIELGGRHLWLGVWERNPRAIAFYRRSGFIDVGSTIYMVGPDRQTDRVMVTALSPTSQENCK